MSEFGYINGDMMSTILLKKEIERATHDLDSMKKEYDGYINKSVSGLSNWMKDLNKKIESHTIMIQSMKRELAILNALQNTPLDSVGLTLEKYEEILNDSKVYVLPEEQYNSMCKALEVVGKLKEIIA